MDAQGMAILVFALFVFGWVVVFFMNESRKESRHASRRKWQYDGPSIPLHTVILIHRDVLNREYIAYERGGKWCVTSPTLTGAVKGLAESMIEPKWPGGN